MDNIIDVGEVARLRTIAVNTRRLSIEDGFGKGRNRRGVCAVRQLARAEYIEISQRRGVEIVAAAVSGQECFAGNFAGGVRTQWQRRHRLKLGNDLGAAISAGAGRE